MPNVAEPSDRKHEVGSSLTSSGIGQTSDERYCGIELSVTFSLYDDVKSVDANLVERERKTVDTLILEFNRFTCGHRPSFSFALLATR